jgi:hypothetical protein
VEIPVRLQDELNRVPTVTVICRGEAEKGVRPKVGRVLPEPVGDPVPCLAGGIAHLVPAKRHVGIQAFPTVNVDTEKVRLGLRVDELDIVVSTGGRNQSQRGQRLAAGVVVYGSGGLLFGA